MTLLLIFFYLFILIGVILISFLIGKNRIKLHQAEENTDLLEDLLDSAPDGYYYESFLKKGNYAYCSRRLCLLLNIVDKKTSFLQLLSSLDDNRTDEIITHYNKLKETGTPFDINVASANSLMHFTISGRLLYTANQKGRAIVIWFKDTTDKTALLIEERQSYLKLLQQREILTQTLNTLPFPLYMQDENANICFANSAYSQDKEDDADIHWVELQLNLSKNKYLLKYGQDKTTEEGLTAMLNDAERAHKMLLKELPYGIVLFDASAKLCFFNTTFCDIWNIESYFLKKEPTFSEVLDKIQEKGLLPQIKDFAQYKKVQQNNFAQLTKTTEDFLYLNGGQIVRRLMIPAAKGGILILDERK